MMEDGLRGARGRERVKRKAVRGQAGGIPMSVQYSTVSSYTRKDPLFLLLFPTLKSEVSSRRRRAPSFNPFSPACARDPMIGPWVRWCWPFRKEVRRADARTTQTLSRCFKVYLPQSSPVPYYTVLLYVQYTSFCHVCFQDSVVPCPVHTYNATLYSLDTGFYLFSFPSLLYGPLPLSRQFACARLSGLARGFRISGSGFVDDSVFVNGVRSTTRWWRRWCWRWRPNPGMEPSESGHATTGLVPQHSASSSTTSSNDSIIHFRRRTLYRAGTPTTFHQQDHCEKSFIARCHRFIFSFQLSPAAASASQIRPIGTLDP